VKSGLAPIANPNARILILGTLPGDESIRQQQYYAHPRNQFWRILTDVYGEPFHETYAERVAMIARHDLAVWDVLRSADRAGSLDTAIQNAVPNEFGAFFARHSRLEAIAFNGQKSHALFRKHVLRDATPLIAAMRIEILPSTSPAATRPFDEKVIAWRTFLTE
jgi:double-stranded uracil-DNA glycosylase